MARKRRYRRNPASSTLLLLAGVVGAGAVLFLATRKAAAAPNPTPTPGPTPLPSVPSALACNQAMLAFNTYVQQTIPKLADCGVNNSTNQNVCLAALQAEMLNQYANLKPCLGNCGTQSTAFFNMLNNLVGNANACQQNTSPAATVSCLSVLAQQLGIAFDGVRTCVTANPPKA